MARRSVSKNSRKRSSQPQILLANDFLSQFLSHQMKKKLKLVFTFISTVAIMRIAMHNILGKNRILKDGEVTTEANYLNDHRTEASEWKPKYIYDFTKVELLPSIPNPEFVFHNKLPKCGSTTMNDIVKALSHRNNFNYVKMDAEMMQFDDEKPLLEWLKQNLQEPFFLMQHHYWMNFTKHGYRQPTMINVIREPMDWFSSHYHFKLYGWARKAGTRAKKETGELLLEDCIMQEAKDCTRNPWRYIEFFVGSGLSEAYHHRNGLETDAQKQKAVEHAKMRLIKDYHVIGVLEQFEETLELFEAMMPKYYDGALKVYKSNMIQQTKNQTKSLNKKILPDDAVNKMKSTVLRYESDLYDFTRALFNERLRALRGGFFANLFKL